jgi:hypothetical protein
MKDGGADIRVVGRHLSPAFCAILAAQADKTEGTVAEGFESSYFHAGNYKSNRIQN